MMTMFSSIQGKNRKTTSQVLSNLSQRRELGVLPKFRGRELGRKGGEMAREERSSLEIFTGKVRITVGENEFKDSSFFHI